MNLQQIQQETWSQVLAFAMNRKSNLEELNILAEDLTRKAYNAGRIAGIESAIELVKSNSKGSFTDEGGNDCWYIDSLENELTALLSPKETESTYHCRGCHVEVDYSHKCVLPSRQCSENCT